MRHLDCVPKNVLRGHTSKRRACNPIARIFMNAIFVLLAVSAILGVTLGLRFPWPAILVSGTVLSIVSATILQKAGFAYLEGIAIIVACLTINQVAYLIGVKLRLHG
jgi:hypothetical protein